ncbi:MAG: hypothetical protein FWC92_07160 [Defluviitaleaceae bacterium]|nr:hypothetical protein [Defluviitaleaceae bacterium]
MFHEIIKKISAMSLLIAVVIALACAFVTGILANTQQMDTLNTFSGGLPLTWFEYYYPLDVDLNLRYVISNFHMHYMKIDLLVLVINIVLINLVIGKLLAFVVWVHFILKNQQCNARIG